MSGHNTNDSDSPTDWQVVVADAVMNPPCTGLLCSAAGTLNVTTVAGTTLDMPMQAGYNPGRFVSVNTGGDLGSMTVRAAFYDRTHLED